MFSNTVQLSSAQAGRAYTSLLYDKTIVSMVGAPLGLVDIVTGWMCSDTQVLAR